MSYYLEKLKNKVQRYQNFILPTIVEENFLNFQEVEEIKNKVIDLKYLWTYLDPVNGMDQSIPVRFLSQGMYSTIIKKYLEHVAFIKPVMAENFSFLYSKILSRIKEYFNIDTVFSEVNNYPGFHIFMLADGFKDGTYKFYNFHKDRFDLDLLGVSKGKIYSFVIPISLPKDNGALLYSENNLLLKKIPASDSEYNQLDYKVGMLGMWGSDIVHSIKPFQLSGDESRITVQFHVNLTEDQAIIFW